MNKIKNKKLSLRIYITLLILMFVFLIVNNKVNKSFLNISPQMKKIQSYEIVKSGDDNIYDKSNNLISAIKFDAFFLIDRDDDEEAEKIRRTCNELGTSQPLYMEIVSSEQGYIKDGKIKIDAQNFYFNTTIVKDNEIKSNYISNNTSLIELNNINTGTQKLIIGNVRSGAYNFNSLKCVALRNNINYYSKDNYITFSGTYVNGQSEVEFEKKVRLTVDWYGSVTCHIAPVARTITASDLSNLIVDDQVKLNYDISVYEDENLLLLDKCQISGQMPTIKGNLPTSFKIKSPNTIFTYDDQTGSFVATRQSETDENGNIIKNAYTSTKNSNLDRYTDFSFEVTYPISSFDFVDDQIQVFEISIPITAQYFGYNNPSVELGFSNPYESDIQNAIIVINWINQKPSGAYFEPKAYVSVGQYESDLYRYNVISKKKPYNLYNNISSEEINDNFDVKWYVYTGTDGQTQGLILKENETDSFKTKDDQKISMQDISSNIGIYFKKQLSLLGTDGLIKVYDDDTDTLIQTFDSKIWYNYDEQYPYYFSKKIDHIRVETTSTNPNCELEVYFIKQIDDEYLVENYTSEEFENFAYIYSTLSVNAIDGFEKTSFSSAYYVAPVSNCFINIEDSSLSTAQLSNNNIRIKTDQGNIYKGKWENAKYLIKLPQQVIYSEITNLEINDENISILGYETYESDGNWFIKIVTSGATYSSYEININCNLTPDPRCGNITSELELFAINDSTNKYYKSNGDLYDIDGDSNVEELVFYKSIPISFNSGETLTTTEIAYNFDNEKQILAPNIANVAKNQNEASVKILAINNYSHNITNVSIIGVIPFVNNKYILSTGDLNSNYSTKMKNTAIKVLNEDLADKVKIYYSTNEKPTGDLDVLINDWKKYEDVENWDSIKSYQIIIDNSYNFSFGETLEFSYDIIFDNNVSYNDITYSQHAIYFALETEKGLLYTQTASAKLGFRIARQYNLKLTKYQTNKQKTLKNVEYILTDKEDNTSILKTTNREGFIDITNIYVGKTYILKEIKTIDNYQISQDEIEFLVSDYLDEDNAEKLDIFYSGLDDYGKSLENKYVSVRSVTIDQDRNCIAIDLENDVIGSIEITKTNQDTNAPIKNIKFKLNGKEKDNQILTTDENGKILISNIYLNEQYQLEEIKAQNYYLPEDVFTFELINNEGEFELRYQNNRTFKNYTIDYVDEIPIVRLNLQNKKIPTYSLKINKYAKNQVDENNEDLKLANSQFSIKRPGIKNGIQVYQTNTDGLITIDNLYEYVENRPIDGIYEIREVFAPSGYVVNPTIFKFKAKRESGILKLEQIDGIDLIRDIPSLESSSTKDISIINDSSEYPTISIGIDNVQIFSLFKYFQDGENKVPIQGVKFKILDDNGDFAKDYDGNYIGNFETIQSQVIPNPKITMTSQSSNPWKLFDDGTWASTGMKSAHSKSSTITSNDFILVNDATLSFDWAVSSESGYDYVYYTITNVDTGVKIGGSSDSSAKKSGSSSSDYYEGLSFTTKTFELQKGKYNIAFTYTKDSSVDKGLDCAYVRNINVSNKATDPITGYYLTTDEYGMIYANLPSGIYTAVEESTKDGFILDTNEKNRSYNFGIGKSQPYSTDWVNTIRSMGWNYMNCVIPDSDGGVISCRSYSDSFLTTTQGIDINQDGEIELDNHNDNDGLIIKYESNGQIQWTKTIYGQDDDVLNKIIKTKDQGFIVVGSTNSQDVYIDNVLIEDLSNTQTEENKKLKDGIIIKFDKNGTYQWSIRIGSKGEDSIDNIIELSDSSILISGKYNNYGIDLYETENSNIVRSLNYNANYDTFVAKYTSNGKYVWHYEICDEKDINISSCVEINNNIVLAVNNLKKPKLVILDSNGQLLKEHSNYKLNIDTGVITCLDKTQDGKILASINKITSNKFDGFVYKIDLDGTYDILYQLVGSYDDYISCIKSTKTGGVIIGGWYYSSNLKGSDNTQIPANLGNYACDGFVIRLDSSNNVAYASRLYGDNYDEVVSVCETLNNNIALCGSFNSLTLSATNCYIQREDPLDDSEVLAQRIGNSDGFVILTNAAKSEVADSNYLEVENLIQKFKITTQIIKNNNQYGRTITGSVGTIDGIDYTNDGKRYVEKVDYNKNSQNQIVITPDSGYLISKIYINEKEYTNYVLNEDKSVTIPIFENVQNDINIKVEFSSENSNVEANFYLYDKNLGLTTTKVAQTITLSGQIGSTYQILPNTDIDYDLITNKEYYGEGLVPDTLDPDDYYIPSNYTGLYTSDKITINYYYKEKTYNITIHHYLNGTNTKVPKKGTNLQVDDIVISNLTKGTNYTTEQLSDDMIDYFYYELAFDPENKDGIINSDIEITYYYRLITQNIIFTKVASEDNNIKIENTEFKLYKVKEDGLNLLVDPKNIGSNFEEVGLFNSNHNGIINLEDLEKNSVYRLVETKSSSGRLKPNRQWNISFVNYIENENEEEQENNIINYNEVFLKIDSINNPPAILVTEDGMLNIPNNKYYIFPITGKSDAKNIILVGIIFTMFGILVRQFYFVFAKTKRKKLTRKKR